MKEERIDTTQFEGHTEGPWLWREATYANAVVKDKPCKIADRCYDNDCIHWAIAEKIVRREDGLLMAAGPDLLAELKRMYEREDALVSAIKELCDSEDSTGCSGDLTVVSLDPMLKLYELTSE